MEIEHASGPGQGEHGAGKVAGGDFGKKRGNMVVEDGARTMLLAAAGQGRGTAVGR